MLTVLYEKLLICIIMKMLSISIFKQWSNHLLFIVNEGLIFLQNSDSSVHSRAEIIDYFRNINSCENFSK